MKEEIRRSLQNDEAERQFYDYAERLANIAYDSPDSLDPAAEALGLKVQTSDWLQRTGSDNPLATGKVMAAAFGDEVLKQGYNSELIELDTDTVVVVRVAEYKEESTRPFEEVADGIRQELETRAKSQAAGIKAAKLLERLNAGESLQQLAESESLRIDSDITLKRDSGDIPMTIVKAAYALAADETGKQVYTSAALATGNHAVIALQSVTDGDATATDAAAREALRSKLASTRGEAALDAYLSWLRHNSSVEVMQR